MNTRRHEQGQLLMEILLVTAAAVVVVGLGAQIVSTSLRGEKTSGERASASALMDEEYDAVQAAATEKWQNLYGLLKGPANHYHTEQSGTKWVFTAGDENGTLNGVSYTRYFYVEDVSRDLTTRHIEASYSAPHDDPSTQRVTGSVVYGDVTVSSSIIVERWRNKVCLQTSWSAVAGGPVSCPSSNYSAGTNMDFTTPGSLMLLAQ